MMAHQDLGLDRTLRRINSGWSCRCVPGSLAIALLYDGQLVNTYDDLGEARTAYMYFSEQQERDNEQSKTI